MFNDISIKLNQGTNRLNIYEKNISYILEYSNNDLYDHGLLFRGTGSRSRW